MTRRVVVVGIVVALGLGVFAIPAGAATSNPCKLLKQGEIFSALDGTVSSPQKGLATAHVTTVGGQAVYDGLKKQTAQFVAVPELRKSLYQKTTGALSVLQGGKYLTVQGVFIATSGHTDVEPQLIELMKIARKRV